MHLPWGSWSRVENAPGSLIAHCAGHVKMCQIGRYSSMPISAGSRRSCVRTWRRSCDPCLPPAQAIETPAASVCRRSLFRSQQAAYLACATGGVADAVAAAAIVEQAIEDLGLVSPDLGLEIRHRAGVVIQRPCSTVEHVSQTDSFVLNWLLEMNELQRRLYEDAA
jgi:hypothetical protein